MLIVATHLAICLAMGYSATRDNLKNMLWLMHFYYILHKNSIGHLLRTSRDYFCPPPPKKKV